MTPEAFHAAALALPGATFDIKWGADRCYCVGERLFAAAGHLGDQAPCYSFKASDMAFELLIEHGVAQPAPYAARAKWVRLVSANALPDQELIAYVAHAHALVAAKLSRKKRAELGLA